ncbi:4-hydroxy-4-methyl-2-oxoglutarate aldolase [Streptomyces sp. LBL]|uniref:RraA family protein n=1 Tax=Streptomyces sp. LBL TaxID=2940562 RepID=UPI0024771E3E|nr:RraA family protein [Streptomyces sp. LBL]MDH6622614.1 4-hydroxy-4-methyl-2-oxoglutarate aldolase [Streptomyces sp. LBL]
MDELTQRASALPTAALSDALDALGLPGSVLGIAPLSPTAQLTGPAFTVAYAPADEGKGSVGDFLDDVPPGAVVVIDNAGRTDCTVWGGIMTQTAAARGLAGTVVHGACRDVATSLSESYPLFSCGRFMRTGKDRVRLAMVGTPLSLGGVPVAPGDLVRGDSDGVVVIPAARLQEVIELAERIEDTEHGIVTAVRAGHSLRQARADFGYHLLQRGRR